MDQGLQQFYRDQARQEILDRLARLERAAWYANVEAWSYTAWFALFAAFALLLLLCVFWRRGRVLTRKGWREETEDLSAAGALRLERSHAGACALAGLLLLCAVSHQLTVDRDRGFVEDRFVRMERDLREAERRGPQAREEMLQSQYLYLPKGEALRYLSFGNTALAADYMWLTSLQYISSPFRRGQKFDLMYRFYNTTLDLDPQWTAIHARAGKLLSALDPDRYRAECFFRRAITLNPEDWVLSVEAGRLFVVPPARQEMLKDYSTRAADYFTAALRHESIPVEMRKELEDLIGRLRQEGEEHEIAAEYLWKVANDPDAMQALRDGAARQWLNAESHVRVERFQELLDRYRARAGGDPPYLAALVKEKGHALDAYGYRILIDKADGKVYSDGVRCLRAVQVSTVVHTLINVFAHHVGRPPRDLAELSRWCKGYFSADNEASFVILDAIGQELDCTKNPLGGAWDYDPQTGKINLPERCNIDAIFANAEMPVHGRSPPLVRYTVELED
ncbi:MAG: hypothetical protein M5U26_02170 [Planctomycetota bacterium]|nr:hypothetical protein [Planctomycetota bacterium]